jgi:SAM-dependent methyltransferase
MDRKFTFNEDPELYERMRPKYPENLINDIIEKTSLSKDKEILEIGPGTGQITCPFAEKGFSITCIELGKELAEFLVKKFSGCQNVKVVNSSFEDWINNGKTFDLIISAQAFHWIDKQIGYSKAASLLKPGGFLALVWIYDTIEFSSEFEKVYAKYTPENKTPESIEIQTKKRYLEIESVKIFNDIKTFQYPFSIEYSTEEHLDLLNTYSDHRTLENETKTLLFRDIKEIIDKHGGKVRKDYVAVLYLIHN